MKKQTRTIIEITGQHIKLLQIGAGGAVHCLVGDIQKLTEDAMAKQIVAMANTQKLNLKSSEIVAVIPRQSVILRHLKLPSENLEELAQMVNLQAINHIPYAREEVVVDFLVLGAPTDGFTKVLVIVVPKDAALRVAKILALAKIPLHRITVSSMGIFHWFQRHALKGTGVAVLLDIGEKDSELCICNDKYLFTSRHVPVGAKEIQEKDYEEFLKQIDMTVESYTKERLGPPVSRLEIFYSMDGLEDFLEQLKKEYVIPIETVRTRKSIKWPQGVLAGGPALTAALGLSTGDLAEDIDLIPQEIKDAEHHKKLRSSIIRLSVLGIAAAVALIFALNLDTMYKQSYLKNLESKVKEAKAGVNLVEVRNKQVQVLKDTLENRVVFIDVVNEIDRLLPKDTSLINLTISNGRILSLQGVSKDGSDINQMQKAMVDSPKFSNVNLDYVTKRITQDGEVNYFKMTCQVK